MDMEFPRYINDMQHEAGYDAYITGISFLKLLSYVGKYLLSEYMCILWYVDTMVLL